MKPDRIGKYSILGELGKGSMGVVYEGQAAPEQPPVAVKVFFPDTQLSPEELATLKDRFDREGAALTSVHHPNVVEVLEVGQDGGHEYIVMEKLPGLNLKELLQLGTRFTLAETIDIILQLLAGLGACHKSGLVHRDVKPANLVRSPQGEIKLTDFGIARVLKDATLARSGTVVGTPNYMSPEQIRGENVDARSDIFSAGVLMYELLTGRKPFDGPDVTAIMYNVANVQPPSLRFYNGALPEELDAVVFAALAKRSEERYPDTEQFSSAIRRLEQSLHFRDDTEAVLNALPASPDADASIGGAISGAPAPGVSAAAGTGVRASTASIAGIGAGIPAIPGVQLSGTVYCVDCGAANSESQEFCLSCMRPLLKRSTIHQMAAAQARMLGRTRRVDMIFLSCLSVVMVTIAIAVIWLMFFKQ
ncbi:serine/threonine protein kinase [bacterium]|nr:serine/threonine protein kinase [bacterium]